MADTKITALAAITTVDPAADVLPIVDISDTSMAASGTTKKITSNQILGSGGTATLASATITGDLTVDTSTLKVDSTNNRVGIGTAAPYTTAESLSARTTALTSIGAFATMPLTVTDSTAFAANVGGGINFRAKLSASLYSDYAAIWSQREVATSNDYKGSLIFGTSDNANGYPIERFSIASTGNVSIANGNVVMATSGKGIDFSATTSGSGTMTSELLNDYEEGTWVPTDASGAGLTFTVSSCRYTKVGRLVTVQGIITYPATVSGATTSWGGFPFNAGDIFALNIIYSDAPIANVTYISSNTVNAFLLTPGVNVSNATMSGKFIVFSGTYMV